MPARGPPAVVDVRRLFPDGREKPIPASRKASIPGENIIYISDLGEIGRTGPQRNFGRQNALGSGFAGEFGSTFFACFFDIKTHFIIEFITRPI